MYARSRFAFAFAAMTAASACSGQAPAPLALSLVADVCHIGADDGQLTLHVSISEGAGVLGAANDLRMLLPPPARTTDVRELGSGRYLVTVADLTAAGAQTLSVTYRDQIATATVEVDPGAADAHHSRVTVSSGDVAADGVASAAIVVRPFDAYGNPTPGRHVVVAAPTGAAVASPALVGDGGYTIQIRDAEAESIAVAVLVDGQELDTRPSLRFVGEAGYTVSISPSTTVPTAGATVELEISVNRDGVPVAHRTPTVEVLGQDALVGALDEVAPGVYHATAVALHAAPVTVAAHDASGASASVLLFVVAATPTRLDLRPLATTTSTADGHFDLEIDAVDSFGNGVFGLPITVGASEGNASKIDDRGDGRYFITITGASEAGTVTFFAATGALTAQANGTVVVAP